MSPLFDRRPLIVALAGPNGAGKTTFYHSHLRACGLHFINADILSAELGLKAYDAADVATVLRQSLLEQKKSFILETVLSDPVGDKVTFLKDAAQQGFTVVMCFIGISSPEVSDERVAMRVSNGGHDVPTDKLLARFPRTMANLKSAIQALPHVIVFDNDDLRVPFRQVAVFENGTRTFLKTPVPKWLSLLMQSRK